MEYAAPKTDLRQTLKYLQILAQELQREYVDEPVVELALARQELSESEWMATKAAEFERRRERILHIAIKNKLLACFRLAELARFFGFCPSAIFQITRVVERTRTVTVRVPVEVEKIVYRTRTVVKEVPVPVPVKARRKAKRKPATRVKRLLIERCDVSLL